MSTLPTFAVRWLIPRLSAFQRAHRNIDVRLSTTYRAVDFLREDYDLAIRYGSGDWKGLSCDHLFDDELVPVCSHKYLGTGPPLREADDLARHTLLHSDTCPENWRLWLSAVGARNVDPGKGLRFDSCLLTLEAAQKGLGVAVANRHYVAQDLAAGGLVAPFEFVYRNKLGQFLVCPAATAEQPKIAAFREWLLAQRLRAGAEMTEVA